MTAPACCAHCAAPIGALVFAVRLPGGRELLVCSRRCQRREQCS